MENCSCRYYGECDGSCTHPEPPVTLQCCDACGSECFERYTITVYEHGCGFGHEDVALDYSRLCKCCEGTGLALIECEPCPDIEDAYERSDL